MSIHLLNSSRSTGNRWGHLPTAMVGLAAVMTALAVAAYVGTNTGAFWAQSAAARASDQVRQGVIGADGAWSPFVLMAGVSALMVAVVVVLRGVIATITGRLGRSGVAYLPGLLTPSTSKNLKRTTTKER